MCSLPKRTSGVTAPYLILALLTIRKNVYAHCTKKKLFLCSFALSVFGLQIGSDCFRSICMHTKATDIKGRGAISFARYVRTFPAKVAKFHFEMKAQDVWEMWRGKGNGFKCTAGEKNSLQKYRRRDSQPRLNSKRNFAPCLCLFPPNHELNRSTFIFNSSFKSSSLSHERYYNFLVRSERIQFLFSRSFDLKARAHPNFPGQFSQSYVLQVREKMGGEEKRERWRPQYPPARV